jgi:hypothetical protein
MSGNVGNDRVLMKSFSTFTREHWQWRYSARWSIEIWGVTVPVREWLEKVRCCEPDTLTADHSRRKQNSDVSYVMMHRNITAKDGEDVVNQSTDLIRLWYTYDCQYILKFRANLNHAHPSPWGCHRSVFSVDEATCPANKLEATTVRPNTIENILSSAEQKISPTEDNISQARKAQLIYEICGQDVQNRSAPMRYITEGSTCTRCTLRNECDHPITFCLVWSR